MKTLAIADLYACNGRVGRNWTDHALDIDSVFGPIKFCLTTAAGDSMQLVRQAIHTGAERIVIVDGDG